MIGKDLETAYAQMVKDEEREKEALEWSEATGGDIDDEIKQQRSSSD